MLHLSHGQTVPVVLMTCCLRAARFLSGSATATPQMTQWLTGMWSATVLDQMELCVQ